MSERRWVFLCALPWVLAFGLLAGASCRERKAEQTVARPTLGAVQGQASDTVLYQNYIFGRDTVKVGVNLQHHADSVRVVDTIFVPDTILAPPAASAGVDTLVKGDTTKLTYWSLKKSVDSIKVTVQAAPVTLGKPYGPNWLLATAQTLPLPPFTLDGAANSSKPNYLLDNIAAAYRTKTKFVATLPCGSHSGPNHGACVRDSSGQLVFYPKGYDSLLAFYNTQAVKDSVRRAYRDGMLVAILNMDEPWVSGAGDGNTWGPAGTMTRARVDSLCAKVKAVLPEVPVGPGTHAYVWDPKHTFKVCDIGFEQQGWEPAGWTDAKFLARRDSALKMAANGGWKVVFSYNILNGGYRDTDTNWDCANSSGIKGTYAPLCMMAPVQVIKAGDWLGEKGCGGLLMWRYDKAQFARTGFAAAFDSVSSLQKRRPAAPCVRR